MTAAAVPPILALDDVAFAYPGRPPLFEGLNFALRKGEAIGLLGPNGSGKTTFLRLIMGLETPTRGRILHHGDPVADAEALGRLRRNVGFVLQNSDDQLFSITVLEDVAFGPLNLGLGRAEARERAMETLSGLGLEALAERPAHRLSVGEKKMVSIASVLSMRPDAILLDEPSASLDDAARDRVIEILEKRDIARIVVSHDREFLARTAARFMAVAGDGTIQPRPLPPPHDSRRD